MLPYASVIPTTSGNGTACPATALWPLPLTIVMIDAGPAVAVSVKLSVVRPGADAVTVSGPALVPSVYVVCATPSLPVVTFLGLGLGVPSNGTCTPATGLSCASATSTASGMGSSVATVPVWPSPVLIVNFAAAPAFPVAEKVTGAMAPIFALAVPAPTVLPSVQVALVRPSAPVTGGAEMLPPPESTVKVTVAP